MKYHLKRALQTFSSFLKTFCWEEAQPRNMDNFSTQSYKFEHVDFKSLTFVPGQDQHFFLLESI